MKDAALQPGDSVESLYCPQCGYDLRSISSPRCPECGLTIDFSAVSTIPWRHRHQIGRFRAFCRTVWLTTIHTRKIAAATAAPIDEKSANRFRWCVIAITALPLFATTIIGLVVLGRNGGLQVSMLPPSMLYNSSSPPAFSVPAWEASLSVFNGITLWPIACVGIVVTLVISTAAPSFLFRSASSSPEQQKRAVAISQYASAPLVLLIVPSVLAIFVVQGYTPDMTLFYYCGACIVAPLMLYELTTLRLLYGATHCGIVRILFAGISLPVLWAFAAGIGLGLFPAVFGLLRMMIGSLRW